MIANMNPETGIRYGVVALDSLQNWVFDEFFYSGENLSFAEWAKDWRAENPDASDDDFDEASEAYEGDEEVYELDTGDGLLLHLSYLGGAPLVWVLLSPHTTHARLCSPCVPNAGDLDGQNPDGCLCYTLPDDWFAESAT